MSTRTWTRGFIMTLVCVIFFAAPTSADTLQSTNYKFDAPTFGAGTSDQSSSTSYTATTSLGDIAVGNAGSSGYQVNSGTPTTPDPTLMVSVSAAGTSFGAFSPVQAVTTTATFSVENYTTYGYVVQIIGTPPTYDGHVITPITTNDQSHVGTSQFGINLVANTAPSIVGANPDNGLFGHGVVDANYSQPDYYRYVSGETIASAPKDSGVTNYTITFLANVDPLTPGGVYLTTQTLVVTGMY